MTNISLKEFLFWLLENNVRTFGVAGGTGRIHNVSSADYIPSSEGRGTVTWLELGGISLGKSCSRILVCLLLSSCAHLSCVDTSVYILMELWHQASVQSIWISFPVKCWAVGFKWIELHILKRKQHVWRSTLKEKYISICFWNSKSKSYMIIFFQSL